MDGAVGVDGSVIGNEKLIEIRRVAFDLRTVPVILDRGDAGTGHLMLHVRCNRAYGCAPRQHGRDQQRGRGDGENRSSRHDGKDGGRLCGGAASGAQRACITLAHRSMRWMHDEVTAGAANVRAGAASNSMNAIGARLKGQAPIGRAHIAMRMAQGSRFAPNGTGGLEVQVGAAVGFLSQYMRVPKLSAPCLATAAATLVALSEYSVVG